jgi:hypothetical protein
MAMTMFTPIPTLLTVILTASHILSALADVPLCFYPDGSQAQSDYACNLTAEHSFCCAIGYNCLDNKICVAEGYSDWNRGSCTDKTWNSPDCPRFCMDFSSSGGSWLVNCAEDAGVCCYDTLAASPEDCCSANLTGQNPVSKLPGEPTPFTLITSGASTQTRVLSSSSSSSSSISATSATSSSTTSTISTSTSTTSAVSTPSSTSSPIDSSPAPTPAASSSDSTLTTGAYVGIAIGIAAAIGLLGAAIFLFRRRQRSNRQQSQSPMTPLVSPPWNNNSPDFPHGDKEQGGSYEYRTSEVAQLHELTAESERPELRGETLLELEGSNERR